MNNEDKNKLDFLGITLFSLGILCNRWLIENTVVSDKRIDSTFFIATISLFQALCLLLGVALLRKESSINLLNKFRRAVGYEKNKTIYINRALRFIGVLSVASALCGFVWYWNVPLVRMFNLPESFSRRSGYFSVNIGGTVSKFAKEVRYRLNDAPWYKVSQGGLRASAPLFVIELAAEELHPGANTLTLEASAIGRPPQYFSRQFNYDSSPISLPVTKDWLNSDVENYDGCWEAFLYNGDRRVRPKPGFEGYDRILVVTGAFSAGRRIETDVIFRYKTTDGGEFIFGVLPLWGGHPDDVIHNGPRRGWNFSLVCYWNRYHGVGNEISYKLGKNPHDWVNSYRHVTLEAGVKYAIVVECWPELNDNGRHLRYRQRSKWWKLGTTEPGTWLELTDTAGAPIPSGEYGIALLAYNCQADFGPVIVKPLAELMPTHSQM